MKVTEAIKARRTVRGFRPDPVPSDVLNEIFELAQLAPSNCNIQSWRVDVLSGDAKDTLSAALIADVTSGKAPNPVFQPGDFKLNGVYRDRQVDCAVRYYSVMGIGREDRDQRNQLMLRNWRFFDAPHVAIFSMPRSMKEVNAMDIGIYLHSLMLLFTERGLGCCAQGALAHFPDMIASAIDLPDDHGILCGMSFGYPDEDNVINEVRMPRIPVDQSVHFW